MGITRHTTGHVGAAQAAMTDAKSSQDHQSRLTPLLQCTTLVGALMTIMFAMPTAHASSAFGFEQVVQQAQQLARQPYKPPPQVAPRYRKLSFDQWNGIQYRADKALWPNTRFRVQLRPAGYLFTHPVAIHLVDAQGVHTLPFQAGRFAYDPNQVGGPLPPDLGYAGLRLLYPINQPDKYDEIITFLGASYFRAVPQHGWFGLSARGLAIDTAEPSGEEFPRFSEFWLVKPAPDADQVTLYALLNSPSATGAYRFIIKPGKQTVVDVKSTLFLRKPVKKLGLAPLTSMYLYGIGDHRPPDSPFPAVHDSDGLLIETGDGKWIWRPLTNPEHLRESSFTLRSVGGFGLMQRDRKFEDYESLNMYYQDRPSAWIKPESDWGPGHLHLVEIATDGEFNDNMVAFWVPDHVPAPGKPLQFDYSIHWQLTQPVRSPTGRVVATLIGGDAKTGTDKFVIDYTGAKLDGLEENAGVRGMVEVNHDAKVVENRVLKNPYVHGWRQVIQVLPLPHQPITVRAYLAKGDQALTETWDYVMPPRSGGSRD